jgi:hypothetical protein
MHQTVPKLKQEAFAVRILEKKLAPTIPPAGDVVKSARKLFPRRPWHARTISFPCQIRQYQTCNLTPLTRKGLVFRADHTFLILLLIPTCFTFVRTLCEKGKRNLGFDQEN